MRGLPSSIRPLELLPSLLAPRSVVPLYLDPRSRTRRRAAVSGCGGTASRRRGFIELLEAGAVLDGPALRWRRAQPVGGVRGRPRRSKRLERLSRPRPAGRESKRARAQPCAARASGAGSCRPQLLFSASRGLRQERTEVATPTSPARMLVSFRTLALSRFSRARARGRGIPGALGARDSSSGDLHFACGRAAVLRTDRARPPSGGGRPR